MLKVVPKVYFLFPISCVCQIKAVPRKCKTSGKYLHVANGNQVVSKDPRYLRERANYLYLPSEVSSNIDK